MTVVELPKGRRYRVAARLADRIDGLHARGYQPTTVAVDKGYDNNRVMDETRERGCVPIVCLPKGRAIPLTRIPYGSDECKRLYRGRAAVERESDLRAHTSPGRSARGVNRAGCEWGRVAVELACS